MSTLVISDAHVGDPRFDSSGIVKLINNINFDKLILNGDIVDFWLICEHKAIKDPLVVRITEIAKEKEVIWVHGNHDYYAKECSLIDNVKVVESYLLEENGIKTLIVHGHQIYFLENRGIWSKIATRINCWIYKHFRFDAQKFFNTGKWYKKGIINKRKKILIKYGKNVNNIIMGHTHVLGYAHNNGVELFDIGSIAIENSYAIITKGHVLLKK